MKRWRHFAVFAVLTIVAYSVYDYTRLPPNMEAMGDNDEMIAKLSLLTAIVSAIAAFFTLLKEAIKMFRNDE